MAKEGCYVIISITWLVARFAPDFQTFLMTYAVVGVQEASFLIFTAAFVYESYFTIKDFISGLWKKDKETNKKKEFAEAKTPEVF